MVFREMLVRKRKLAPFKALGNKRKIYGHGRRGPGLGNVHRKFVISDALRSSRNHG